MRLKFLKLCLVIILLSNCQKSKEVQAPWTGLSWLSQVETTVIIENTLDVEQTVKIHYFNRTTRETIDKTFNLTSGQVDSISISLFRPELIEIKHSSGYYPIYLLPKMVLELSFHDTISINGENKDYYSSLFEVGQNEIDKITLDSLIGNTELPYWLTSYLYRSNELEKLYKVHQQISYQQFIGNRDISVSLQDSTLSEKMLQNEHEARFHNYYSLLQKFRSFYKTRADDHDFPIKKESYKLNNNLANMLLEIQDDKLRFESLAMHTEGLLIRKRKTFEGKDEVYSRMISNLIEQYVLKLNNIEKKYSTQSFAQKAVIRLLKKELTSTEGMKIPLTTENKDFKLLKFWFAGCAPCKKQIPYENALLSEFENLSILHFCKYTQKDLWQKYIIENESKGNHYFIGDENIAEYKEVFALSYSPRYVLLNRENKIICWDCASPNDFEIRKLLGKK